MLLQDFLSSKEGNFASMTAVMLPVLLGAIGLAVDVGTMSSAHSKLQTAVDAAVLAASRINDKALDREQVFKDYLAGNLVGEARLANLVSSLEVDQGINYISTTGRASADVDLFFAAFIGSGNRVSVSASAFESRNNLEVVMALDNTGSMGSARMAELRKAATSLVDILSTVHMPDSEPKRVVKAALVPFVTAVNVKGEGFDLSWIDNYVDPLTLLNKSYGARYHGSSFTPQTNHLELFKALGTEWKGCVEARPSPYNLSDAAPDITNPDTLFVPYFAPDNPGKNATSPNSGTAWNNSYLNDTFGKNDQAKLMQAARYYNVASKDKTINAVDYHQSRTTGPNYACPTPILPLTSDFDKLKAEIARMIHWEGSGTNVSEGLAWSVRVLSPGEPYTQGAPFNSENTSKFVVVFTDGENTVFGASSQAYNKSDYGSYSFLDHGRLGETDRSKALSKVNTMTKDVCTDLKSKSVEIFTVLLGADTAANRKLYSECATTTEHYYPTSDVSELDTVFRKIASRIAKLYVTD
ncbi:pilus assembly protein TadG-related protein [Aquamicrobium sp.]|uniref:TadE/TadG family type IV pilus assembly protein n=1 Tax=Aquamicrobium sp. TaxID=1872579 RepID=UPI00349E6A47